MNKEMITLYKGGNDSMKDGSMLVGMLIFLFENDERMDYFIFKSDLILKRSKILYTLKSIILVLYYVEHGNISLEVLTRCIFLKIFHLIKLKIDIFHQSDERTSRGDKKLLDSDYFYLVDPDK